MARDDAAQSAGVEPPRRGRRLDEDRSEIILATVLELLYECGYDQLRMQDVADRAGVGLSTIYRRWPTKQDVVRAGLECDRGKEKFIVTGDARADMRAILAKLADDLTGDGGQTMLGFLSSMRSDPAVADVFRETVLARMHDHMRGLLASELGDDFPDLDLRAAAGPALLIYMGAVCGQPMDTEEMAGKLTDLLFAAPPA